MIHTESSLREQDGKFENYHYQLSDGDKYQLTDGEQEWLRFVSNRYCIYDHITENMDSEGVYTVNTDAMGQALVDDGMFPKAVCLSDSTTLQKIFFYSSTE